MFYFLNNWIYLISLLTIGLLYILSITIKNGVFWINLKLKKDKLFLVLSILFIILGIIYVVYYIYCKEFWNLLFGALCGYLGIISGPILFSKKEKIIKTLGGFLVLGGFLGMVFGKPGFPKQVFGIIGGTISYFKHMLIICAGILIMGIQDRFDKKDYKYSLIFALIFLMVIVIFSGIPYWVTKDARFGMNSTGFLPPAFFKIIYLHDDLNRSMIGRYYTIGKTIPYPLNTLIIYIVGSLILFFIQLFFPYVNGLINKKNTKK